jgi:F-type H+-transporting ATPase subunit b
MPLLAHAGGLLALLAAEAEGEAGGNPLIRVSPGLWLWTLVIFLLLFLILRKWGFGTMIDKLDARDRAIRGAIEEAKGQRDQAEHFLAEQKALLDKARRDASELLASAQEQGGRERQRIVAEAREEYEKIVARGRSQIEQETRAAIVQVRQSSVSLAVDIASKLVHKNLDQPAQKALAEQFAKELDTM